MTPEFLRNVLEAAMLAAGRALTLDDFLALFEGHQDAPDRNTLRQALTELGESLDGRAVELKEVASGYRLQVRQDYSPLLGGLFAERPPRYSRALLETLALIAYRQPITRGEIEDVRGVAVSSNIIKTLMEREWIRVLGHREVPGRPALFGTTREFLDHFGLKGLDGLPPLAEIKDLEQVEPDLFASMPQDGAAGTGDAAAPAEDDAASDTAGDAASDDEGDDEGNDEGNDRGDGADEAADTAAGAAQGADGAAAERADEAAPDDAARTSDAQSPLTGSEGVEQPAGAEADAVDPDTAVDDPAAPPDAHGTRIPGGTASGIAGEVDDEVAPMDPDTDTATPPASDDEPGAPATGIDDDGATAAVGEREQDDDRSRAGPPADDTMPGAETGDDEPADDEDGGVDDAGDDTLALGGSATAASPGGRRED